jgi:hypothetical protein
MFRNLWGALGYNNKIYKSYSLLTAFVNIHILSTLSHTRCKGPACNYITQT